MSDQAVVDPVIAEVTADPKVTINGHNAESVLSATQELPEEDEQSNEGSDAKPKKGAKSTFVITSVTYNTEAGPNQEELNGEDEEDESVLNDSTPEIDSNQINNAATPIPSNESVKRGDKAADPASRFKVVKVAPKLSEPYIIYRHRWKVTDFLTEPEPSRGTEIITNRTAGTDSSNSSRASSVHYTPGVDDASKNPLAQPSLPTIAQSTDSNPLKDESLEPSKDNGSTSHPEQSNVHVGNSEASTNDQLSSTATSTVVANNSALDQVSNGDHTSASSQPSPQLVTGEASSEPVRNKDSASSVAAGDVTKCADIQADESHRVSQEVNDLGAALEEIVDTPATPAGDSGNVEESDVMASGVAIDNKIEQAMDLVKSHLMLAVREEVEELRLQIKQLLERNAQLEQENQILRSSASPEILAQLNALGHSSNS